MSFCQAGTELWKHKRQQNSTGYSPFVTGFLDMSPHVQSEVTDWAAFMFVLDKKQRISQLTDTEYKMCYFYRDAGSTNSRTCTRENNKIKTD